MNTDTPTFIDKTIDNYNNELTKACLREQLLKEDCQDLERELTAARAELAEMTARAASLAAYLPPDTLCGDIQKWRDEYKMAIDQRDRLAEAIRKHKETLPFAPPPCDKKLYEALAAVEGGSEKPVTLIHNGVGIADMYSRDEFENAMKRTN